ncbi:hypothetical protein M9H77_18902 [Catharanthus roseus]|uniref:Uncharacterized protein n=1 Tax=Catharanthus roseus TaxID=4058 RepID=A0ACC0B8Q6_CATRO|nr:hypothetical protein M9H77_18902 [Catharanthus roseus]
MARGNSCNSSSLMWDSKVQDHVKSGGNSENTSTSVCSSSSLMMPEKGQFSVYTVDQKRYSFPICYLNNYIFIELLRMAEEENFE